MCWLAILQGQNRPRETNDGIRLRPLGRQWHVFISEFRGRSCEFYIQLLTQINWDDIADGARERICAIICSGFLKAGSGHWAEMSPNNLSLLIFDWRKGNWRKAPSQVSPRNGDQGGWERGKAADNKQKPLWSLSKETSILCCVNRQTSSLNQSILETLLINFVIYSTTTYHGRLHSGIERKEIPHLWM